MFAKTSLALGLSTLLFALDTNAWLLGFWLGQAHCNYKIREGGIKEAADTSHGGLDHESNNCMLMSPCGSEMPYDPYEYPEPRRPNPVFTLNSPEAFLSTDDKGTSYACITPLNTYVQCNSGSLCHVSYSCGGNGTLLVELDKNPSLTKDEIKSLIESISASATAPATATITTTTAVSLF
ncbi:hypothetical protein B0T14DRAFT_501009 [Immersiella caudata]|uniref:Uncharacterized protein n=1 Tax=Immersiella caudata TaxID=314043 RepID=A0AA39TP27_9PEZI|nr:hypothetical protein B0T14DRAFT_501009 [Immersiella caudata]